MDILYPIKISTENSEETFVLFPIAGSPKERFTFRVMAKDDVHVGLASSADPEDRALYEFMVGARTLLFKKVVDWEIVEKADSSGFISERSMKGLWVEFENKSVAIGKEGIRESYLEYKEKADDLPPIKFVGIRTGHTERINWEIERPSAVFHTRASIQFQDEDFLPMSFSRGFKFALNAPPGAYILLSPTPTAKYKPYYEIVIGSEDNHKCAILKDGEVIVTVKTDKGVLSRTLNDTFWVRWNKYGDVSFGRDGQSAYVSAIDTKPFDINFAAFRTDHAYGFWRVEQSDIELKIKRSQKYANFIPNSSRRLDFRLRSSGAAYLAFTTKPEDTAPMYELVLGKNGNSTCTIGRNHLETKHASTTDLLDSWKYIGFTVIWGDGLIRVHKEGSSDPFLTIEDTANLPINYVGFRSEKSSTDHYVLQMPRPFVPLPLPSPTWGYDNWVSCENGDVPPFRAFFVVPGSDDRCVIRAHFQGELIPGMLLKGDKFAHVPWGGRSNARSSYEVLCDFNGGWKEFSGSHNIPENALVAGRTAEGEDLYVGRVKDRGLYVVGKVQLSEGVCYISRDANEVPFANYEILVRLDF